MLHAPSEPILLAPAIPAQVLDAGGAELGAAGGRSPASHVAWEEDGRIGFGMHLIGAEALVSRRLTDRLSIRFGASAVVPISVNPIVLLAW